MRLMTTIGALVLAATGIAGGGHEVRAADLGAFYAPNGEEAEPQQPLDFGTGWYLRGDAAYSEEDHPKFDATLGSFDRNAKSAGYAFGLGAGYKFNSWLRADITADYLDPFDYKAVENCGSLCAYSLQTRVWRWDGLANGYVDLGNWFGVTPYIGAGAGVSGNHQDGSVSLNGSALPTPILTPTGTLTTQSIPSRTDYRFAWAAMAGFSYAVSPHMLLDVGYRYLDLGKTTIPLYPLTSVRKDLTAHQIRVGVRYMID